jgi:hypothetical protein
METMPTKGMKLSGKSSDRGTLLEILQIFLYQKANNEFTD